VDARSVAAASVEEGAVDPALANEEVLRLTAELAMASVRLLLLLPACLFDFFIHLLFGFSSSRQTQRADAKVRVLLTCVKTENAWSNTIELASSCTHHVSSG
jgi:hypothetical protein